MPTPCLHIRAWTFLLFDRMTGSALGKLSKSQAMSGNCPVDVSWVIRRNPVPSPNSGPGASAATCTAIVQGSEPPLYDVGDVEGDDLKGDIGLPWLRLNRRVPVRISTSTPG